MYAYYMRLALKSFRRNPGLTALMLGAIALGIAVCIMTMTVYHAMSSNPIWWKSDRLYAVTMDSWPPERPANSDQPSLPPTQLTYADATHLFYSSIPTRRVIMYPVAGVVINHENKPLKVTSRVTSSDFFSAFDVPFLYGSG